MSTDYPTFYNYEKVTYLQSIPNMSLEKIVDNNNLIFLFTLRAKEMSILYLGNTESNLTSCLLQNISCTLNIWIMQINSEKKLFNICVRISCK